MNGKFCGEAWDAVSRYATLIGKSRVHAAVFGGRWHTWHLRQDLQLVKKENRWLIALAEASTY